MTKFGQAEYGDFMARMFADKLDEILETTEKQKIFTKNLYRQKMQLKEVLRC